MSKLISYGIYLLVFLLSLQTRYILKYGELNNGPWEYGTVSLYSLDILIIILLTLTLVRQNKLELKHNYQNYKAYYWLALGLVTASTLSIIGAFNFSLAGFAIVKLILGLSVGYIILNNNFDKLKFWFWFLFGAIIQAGLGIWQFATQSSFANKWLGIAQHTAKELGTSVVEAQATDGIWERWMRAYGGLDHPNILGGFLAIALIITLILFLKNKTKNKKKANDENNENKLDKLELFYYVAIAIITPGLFFSLSRTAWIATIVGIIILLIQQYQEIKKLLVPLIIMMIIIGGLLIQYHYIVFSRFGDMHRIEVTSINERISYVQNAKKLIYDYGIMGVGIGNHGLAVQKILDDRQISYWYQPVHNLPLLIWSEIGLLGILAFLILAIWLLIVTIKKIKKQPQQAVHLPIIIALGIMMMLDHWLWSLHFGNIFLWLLIAMMLKNLKQQPS